MPANTPAAARNTSTRSLPKWITSYLVCDDCGRDYGQHRDECPDCSCIEAELVNTGSVGRFWGYRGLRPVLAAREVTSEIGIRAGRVLRRCYKAKGLTKQVRRLRVKQATGQVSYRTNTVRKRLFRDNRGFVTVNDVPCRGITTRPISQWGADQRGRPG